MTLDLALRFTEIMLGIAIFQQSSEHFTTSKNERFLFMLRALLSLLLVCGLQTHWASLALVISSLFVLKKFQGPYNGGSDRMTLLVLCCLCAASFVPSQKWQEYIFGYLALQCILSYFMAGWVKITNPEWRNGRALQDVFRFTVYPVSESLRTWADWSRLLVMMSWGVMLFELAFPLTLFSHKALVIGLVVAAVFHLANACLFGLNRFFWIWMATYPSILWLQERIFQ